jgi:type III pantothenate kinase
MAWLLIDNSNSRTKFRLGDSGGLLEWNAIMPTQDLTVGSIRSLIDGLDFSGVVVASVVPEKELLLRKVFENQPYHSLTHESPLGYGFDLDAPEQIGHDRLANVAALKLRYGAPSIAIDFGTAVTFKRRKFRGRSDRTGDGLHDGISFQKNRAVASSEA